MHLSRSIHPGARGGFPWELGLALAVLAGSLRAGDWPQWRGPQRTGHASADTPLLKSLPETPRVVWKIPAGDGYSSPVVAGGRVYVTEAQEGNEVLRALDAETGGEQWRLVVDETFRDSQGPPAPRCTPVVAGGRVYAQSCKGRLVCVESVSGKLLWSVNYVSDFGAVFTGEKGNAPGATRHGNNGAPWVAGDWLWASAGSTNGASVVALDAASGAVRWKGGTDIAAYAAPMIAEIHGVRQVVNFMADAAVGMDAEKGTVLWRYPLKTAFARHVMTPLVIGNRVVIGSHQTGLIGLELQKDGADWKVNEAWVNKEASPNFSCPVLVGKSIVGLGPQKNIVGVDPATGKTLWSKPGYLLSAADKAHAGFVVVGDSTVLVLTDGGELVLLQVAEAACNELGRAQVCGANWCNPALVGSRLYLRDGLRNGGNWWCLALQK